MVNYKNNKQDCTGNSKGQPYSKNNIILHWALTAWKKHHTDIFWGDRLSLLSCS